MSMIYLIVHELVIFLNLLNTNSNNKNKYVHYKYLFG